MIRFLNLALALSFSDSDSFCQRKVNSSRLLPPYGFMRTLQNTNNLFSLAEIAPAGHRSAVRWSFVSAMHGGFASAFAKATAGQARARSPPPEFHRRLAAGLSEPKASRSGRLWRRHPRCFMHSPLLSANLDLATAPFWQAVFEIFAYWCIGGDAALLEVVQKDDIRYEKASYSNVRVVGNQPCRL